VPRATSQCEAGSRTTTWRTSPAPFTPLAEPKSGSTDDHSKEPSVEVATPEEASNVVSGDDAEEKETTGEAVKRKAENEETKEEEEGSAEKISS